MTIVVPREVLDVPEPRESRAMRSWMNALTDAANAGGGGDIWRTKTVRTAVHNASAAAPDQIGITFFAVGSFGYSSLNGAVASTNMLASRTRLVLTSAAGANSDARLNGTPIAYWLGNAAGLGGFRVECEFGIVTTTSTLRVAVGLVATAGFVLSTNEPSALTNFVAVGCDSGDTNLQLMHNDGAGSATKIDLGASFPKTNDVIYRAVFTAVANGSSVDYEITRLDSAASASGTVASNLPSSSTFLLPSLSFGNGATAAAVAGCFFRFLSEQ